MTFECANHLLELIADIKPAGSGHWWNNTPCQTLERPPAWCLAYQTGRTRAQPLQVGCRAQSNWLGIEFERAQVPAC